MLYTASHMQGYGCFIEIKGKKLSLKVLFTEYLLLAYCINMIKLDKSCLEFIRPKHKVTIPNPLPVKGLQREQISNGYR